MTKIRYADILTLTPYLNAEQKAHIRTVVKNPTDLFPVSLSFMHNDNEVRARFVLNNNAAGVLVTLPVDVFNNLPVHVEA